LWENQLPGFGYTFVNMAVEGQSGGPQAAQATALAAHRATSAAGAAGAGGAA